MCKWQSLQWGGIAPTIGASHFGSEKYIMEKETVLIKQATKSGYIECEVGGVVDLSFPNSITRRGRVIDEGNTSPTLQTSGDICKIEKGEPMEKYRIRKLTPKESFRLMNFDDTDFYAAESVNSDSQLYKQAGNSIVVSCLCAIFSQLNIQGIKPWNNMEKSEINRLTEVKRCDNPKLERTPL